MGSQKQHYYPKMLLKYFANDDKFRVYIRLANKYRWMNYEKVCSVNNGYKGSVKSNNTLEETFSEIEGELSEIIEKIMGTIKFHEKEESTVDITEDDIEFLYRYMHIQYLRTDAGRINFIDAFREGRVKKYPIKLYEIQDNKKKIIAFNDIFNETGVLNKFMETLKKPKDMNFQISVGLYFITSDNPVIGTDNWRRIAMPISSNLCLEFVADEFNRWGKRMIIPRTDKYCRYLNEAQIETANYYIISEEEFDLPTQYYIYQRFICPNWEKKSRHFKK